MNLSFRNVFRSTERERVLSRYESIEHRGFQPSGNFTRVVVVVVVVVVDDIAVVVVVDSHVVVVVVVGVAAVVDVYVFVSSFAPFSSCVSTESQLLYTIVDTYTYIHTYIHTCISLYIYMSLSLSLSIYIYICTYPYMCNTYTLVGT